MYRGVAVAFRSDDISINTFIGSGSAVSGNLKIAGFVTIHGDLDGDLEATGKVIVSEDARVRGNIILLQFLLCFSAHPSPHAVLLFPVILLHHLVWESFLNEVL